MTSQEQVIADIAREVVARLRIQLQQTAGGFDGTSEAGCAQQRRARRRVYDRG